MKGERLLAVLKFIGDGVVQFVELQGAIINAGYGASSKGIDFELSKIQKAKKISQKEKQERKKLSSLLYKMRRDNLLTKDPDLGSVRLTAKGRDKYLELKNYSCSGLPCVSEYCATGSDVLKVIIFDIPEAQRRKREWLISALRNTGFKMLQKSVWVGKRNFPKDFIRDIYNLGIINCIEVFEVIRMGSLKEQLKSDLD